MKASMKDYICKLKKLAQEKTELLAQIKKIW